MRISLSLSIHIYIYIYSFPPAVEGAEEAVGRPQNNDGRALPSAPADCQSPARAPFVMIPADDTMTRVRQSERSKNSLSESKVVTVTVECKELVSFG